uniref:WAS/WASL interacting protein family member 3 n=1 Tax=Salarias fasciatus TaxID=181472 RepID=A0A672GRX5_SALFA
MSERSPSLQHPATLRPSPPNLPRLLATTDVRPPLEETPPLPPRPPWPRPLLRTASRPVRREAANWRPTCRSAITLSAASGPPLPREATPPPEAPPLPPQHPPPCPSRGATGRRRLAEEQLLRSPPSRLRCHPEQVDEKPHPLLPPTGRMVAPRLLTPPPGGSLLPLPPAPPLLLPRLLLLCEMDIPPPPPPPPSLAPSLVSLSSLSSTSSPSVLHLSSICPLPLLRLSSTSPPSVLHLFSVCPPPLLRLSSCMSSLSSALNFVFFFCPADDFESKYSFHPLDDFPPPDEYRHFTKIYPSRANRVLRGAPPLPPVGR